MTALRYCLPDVTGRGAGLGNELIPWARAFLASQVLNAECLPPAFGLNTRRYGRHFGTPSYDWLQHRLLKAALPVVRFDEADYLRHGGGDVLVALRAFAQEQALHERSAYVMVTQGMWGGLGHIEAARDFVFSTLYRSRFAARNLLRLRERLDPGVPTVGIHVRLGDFGAALQPHEYATRFNVALPLDWYQRVASSIHEQLAGRVQFLVVSDTAGERLTQAFEGLPCVLTGDIPDSDCSDLLALAGCDLLVCSISSYSVWAAFLSGAPYLWYGPNLFEHPEGVLSIWGHEARQQEANSPTRRALASLLQSDSETSRAWAVGHDGRVPAPALAGIRIAPPEGFTDLVRYGVVRSSAGAMTSATRATS